MRIARTEVQSLGNVNLGFFGATYKDFCQSNTKMRVGEISIQLQRVLAFGNAVRCAPGHHVDKSQRMGARMV